MNLRRRFVLYLLIVHGLLGVTAYVLLRQSLMWLAAIELVFLASLAWGIALVTRLSTSLSALEQSAQLLDEGELTTRFREIGHPDVDVLVRTYNRMVDDLRDERTRLQEQHYFLGQLLDVSPAGVIILDHDGAVSSVNPAAAVLLDVMASAALGVRPAALGVPLGRALDALQPGDSRIVTVGSARRIRCQCATFVERGFPRRFYLLEELTEELRRSEKAAYETLIRQMSHEVNNSVGATRSLLQSSLAYGASLPAERQRDLEQALGIASERLERLNAFMRSFADVVRIPEPRRRPCDADALVEGCVRLMQSMVPAGLEWRWDRQGPVGLVDADAAQLEQVFINVLKNAAEAAGDGGAVTVRLGRAADAGHFVEIEDTGPGIPPEVREHLFTPFFTTKQNGHGVGLTVVQEILGRHRFRFSLEGTPGGPTRFRIEFPDGMP